MGYKPTEYQCYCWAYMKYKIMNPIRHYLGIPVIMTNVVRLEKDYQRLMKAGYNPSARSDHYAGQDIKLPGGEIFTESTFAGDFVFEGDMKELCRTIYREANLEIFPKIRGLQYEGIGQLILEGQRLNGKDITWIHIGLAARVMYSESFADYLEEKRKKQRWLEYRNGAYVATRFE